MYLKKSSRILFIIILVALTLLVILLTLVNLTGNIREKTKQEYAFFQKNLFQKSEFNKKTILSLIKIITYDTQLSHPEAMLGEISVLNSAIISHQEINREIDDVLLTYIPDDDPLLLKEKLLEIKLQLAKILSMIESFNEALYNSSSGEMIASVISDYQKPLISAIDTLNDSINLESKIQSVFFSKLRVNIDKTLTQLNVFFYTLTLLFIFKIFLIAIYLIERKKSGDILKEAHDKLEIRVKQRTEELEKEIDERKQIEYELRLKSDALENSLNGFDIVDKDGTFVYANRAYLDMWGYQSLAEIYGTSPASHCVDPSIPDKIINTLKSEERCVIEFTAKRRDGSTFDVLMYARLSYDQKGNEIYPTTSIDISEQKKLEEKLQQAQKLEAIGTLAGGIAHEFNNILGIILGNAELAIEDIPESDLVHEFLVEVKNATVRGKEIVRQLLSFSRKTDQEKKTLHLPEIVKESIGFLRASIPKDILFNANIDEECPPIEGNPTQIHQVLINLCTNASHAMEKSGGTLTIHLETILLENFKIVTDQELHPGRYIRLSISDTGNGIAPDHISRIFEPFFTTKEVGKGSGMGLSVVHGIIKGHHGGIRVKSTKGEGTRIECYFPVMEILNKKKNTPS